MYTLVLPSPISVPYQTSRLQLADEKAGREQTHALGQNVLGEDVDERRKQDEGDGGLVDEEEGDELGHRRLEHGLGRVSCQDLHLQNMQFTIC